MKTGVNFRISITTAENIFLLSITIQNELKLRFLSSKVSISISGAPAAFAQLVNLNAGRQLEQYGKDKQQVNFHKYISTDAEK
jgi:hypothetical protein